MQKGLNAGGVSWAAAGNAIRGVAVVFFLDRVTKTFLQFLPPTDWPKLKGPVTLVHHQNYGIVANFPLPQWTIVAITLLVMAAVIAALSTALREGDKRQAAALGVLLGGAAGNLYDRLTQGFVFDWILLFGRSAINLADITIVVGAVWYFGAKRIDESRDIAQDIPQIHA